MGLAARVIPTVLCRGRQQVKGERFNPWRTVGLAEQAVRVHQARGVDELVLLDVGATPEGRGPDLDLVRELSEGCFMPLAVGGGVRTVEDVRALLQAGADKVVIGTEAWISGLVREASAAVGNQALVVACDVVEKVIDVVGNRCMREVAPERAAWVAERGAGEILLTSIDREGTLQGYDLELIRAVCEAVKVPVIAHGGCRDYADMAAALEAGASAVAAGALFQFTDATPRGAAQFLHARGIEARV
jgi:imidazole glycerol-phosphate synthase subunit HisF